MATTEVHTIAASVHGRYLIRAADAEGAAPLLVGFHGYAETAEENLDQLLELRNLAHWHVVSIQGLHPFYRSRLGDLGASWMTRQDRELAIEDNTRYVGQVLARVKEQLEVGEPLVFVGFSQGTAMAYRAAAGSGHPAQGLIALGGDVPTEILERDLGGFPRVLIGRGTEDKWYDAGKMEHDVDLLGTADIVPETCVFEGGHEWTGEFYRAAGQFLASLEAG
jgi:predicted esterase